MPSLTGLARDGDASLAHRLRQKRFAAFETWCARFDRPLSVLDVGGTTDFWEQRGWTGREDVTITVVNLAAEEQRHDNVLTAVADARDLPYPDKAFDLVHSNSVIQYMTSPAQQRTMADEVRRVGHAYWLQTPNFWFPMEPHFLTPGWQFLPVSARVAILRRRKVGWRGPYPDPVDAEREVRGIRMMRRREIAQLFPEAEIVPERFAGLVKSWTAFAPRR